VTTREIGRRLAELEAAAEKLLAKSESNPLKWLTLRELERLEHAMEAGGGLAEAMWADLRRRVLSRALLNTDMVGLDRQEAEGRLVLRIDHPERPDDPLAKLYIDATEDLVERGRWYLDAWYVQQWPSLPAELSAAEVERLAVRPASTTLLSRADGPPLTD
jgi:hypothetical protein